MFTNISVNLHSNPLSNNYLIVQLHFLYLYFFTHQVKGNTYEFGKLPTDEPDIMQGTLFFESENEGKVLLVVLPY